MCGCTLEATCPDGLPGGNDQLWGTLPGGTNPIDDGVGLLDIPSRDRICRKAGARRGGPREWKVPSSLHCQVYLVAWLL